MSRPRRHAETHRPRVELVVDDSKAWRRWQLLQLERARTDEERRRLSDRGESTRIGVLVVIAALIGCGFFFLLGVT